MVVEGEVQMIEPGEYVLIPISGDIPVPDQVGHFGWRPRAGRQAGLITLSFVLTAIPAIPLLGHQNVL